MFDLWLALKQKDFNIENTIQVFDHYMQKEGKTITHELFEENLDLKLQEHSFLDDIGQLLSSELMQSHAVPMKFLDGEFMTFLDGGRMHTSGWSLIDAAKEIKDKILVLLPN